jgi:SOS-response transcriptional repressor LexA
VNVGPADQVRAGQPGYPICTVCGAARSPYASPAELGNFQEWHMKNCGRPPQPIALTADVLADCLHVKDLDDQADAANLGEAIRIGAAQVLDMEPDDLQILPVPTAAERWDLYVYDPMPGGSGLLAQALERWERISEVLHELLGNCPGGCETSCYSCMRTGRNVFWHRLLNRGRALELVDDLGHAPERGHELNALVDASFGPSVETTNDAEDRLKEKLRRAGLDGFVGQHPIALDSPFERTVVDFAYVDQQVAVYLDGLSRELHGNAERARVDAIIRDQLEDRDWKVIVVPASYLDDPEALAAAFRRIARAVNGKEAADAVVADRGWLNAEPAPPEPSSSRVAVVPLSEAEPYRRHVPLYSIRAAAGKFLENAEAQEEGWVEAPGRLREGMFALRIEGRSMEPGIPDGSIGLFRTDIGGGQPAGSREGKVVLAALHDVSDPEGGGSFTVKRYHSEKAAEAEGNGGWRRARIVLRSDNAEIPDIELTDADGAHVVAEFVKVLSTE